MTISHADIAVACALLFTREAYSALFDATRTSALGAHCTRRESLLVFREIAQPFIPPS